MLESKIFYIEDTYKDVPIIALKVVPREFTNPAEAFALGKMGFDFNLNTVVVLQIKGTHNGKLEVEVPSSYNKGSLLNLARVYLVKHFVEHQTGDIINVIEKEPEQEEAE